MPLEPIEEAKQLAKSGDLEFALNLFRKAGGPEGLYGAAACLFKLGKIEEARESIRKCLNSDPLHEQALKLRQKITQAVKEKNLQEAAEAPPEGLLSRFFARQVAIRMLLCGIGLCIIAASPHILTFFVWKHGLFDLMPKEYSICIIVAILVIAVWIAVRQIHWMPRGWWTMAIGPVNWTLIILLILLWPYILASPILLLGAGAAFAEEVTANEVPGPGLSREGPVALITVVLALALYLAVSIFAAFIPHVLPSITVWASTPIKGRRPTDALYWESLTDLYDRSRESQRQNLRDLVRLIFMVSDEDVRDYARRFLSRERPQEHLAPSPLKERSQLRTDLQAAKVLQTFLMPFIVIPGIGGIMTLDLRLQNVTTQARVISTADDKVWYEFNVGDRVYTHGDILNGERNSYAEISGAKMREIKESGVLDIRYLPSRPWYNEPVLPRQNSFINKFGLIVFALALELAVMGNWIYRYYRFKRNQCGFLPSGPNGLD